MVENKVQGQCLMDKLYQKAKKNVGASGVVQCANPQIESSYINWKQRIHREYYRLIKEAGIYIEGA